MRGVLPLELLEAHARELAAGHSVARGEGPRRELLVRLERNADRLEEVYKALSEAGLTNKLETPSEEWLRDNHYVVRAQLEDIRRNLPRKYYQELPSLVSGPWKRYPRVYVVAGDFVSHTAGRFDYELLRRFVDAYQDVSPLSIGELWAIPIMLRLALIENLCGLAEHTLAARQEREAARAFAAQLVADSMQSRIRASAQLAKTSATFVVEILHSLRDQSVSSTAAWRWIQRRLSAEGQSPDELLRREQHREAIDQLSIANIIETMRVLSALDWPSFVEAVSRIERILRGDPASAYGDMDRETRDRYRKSVEQLSRRSGVDEVEVAEQAVAFAETAHREYPNVIRPHHVGYYLISRGRFELERAVGYSATLSERISRTAFRHPALGYLGVLAITTGLFEASLLSYSRNHGASWWMTLLVAVITLIPISELALSFINAILTTVIPPRPLPKLELRNGVPDSLKTIVAVPVILSSTENVQHLVDALEVRALANHDANISFALLSDFADADEESLPEDQNLVETASRLIADLNRQYGTDRFYLLHRNRVWNTSEQRWMGWERKRGKLREFNRLLRGDRSTTFIASVGDVERLVATKLVITLDADTDLPLDAGRKLVGTIAHPLNRPWIDARSGRVTEGYGIVQPRVAIGAASASSTTFSRVFSGHVGLDPYTTAVSDVYQDLFQEGSYVGKGIYDVDAFEASLDDRVPENALLSHDLFEGLFARVALCTDLEVIDDFPSHYLTWVSRLHRWVRGDWQLLPWLTSPMPAISRWKIFDNLRRSLLPSSLVLLLAAGWLVLPGGPALWTGVAFFVLFFPAYVQWGQSLSNRLHGVRLRDHLRAERDNIESSLQQIALTSAFLAHQSFVALDAIARTLVRLYMTRRHLLEWMTSAEAALRLETRRSGVLRQMWSGAALAVVLGVAILAIEPSSMKWALPVLLAWAASPWLTYETGLPAKDRRVDLTPAERGLLQRSARLTWRYFETVVSAEDHWLVPDNYQENRHDVIAHRTSPTNIGLQLLATVAAWDFGYLSSDQCLTYIERTVATVEKLPRYRGHLFNWYDTQTLAPLAPLYVSTVDSGNLLGYLLTIKTTLVALAAVHRDDQAFARALSDTLALYQREAEPLIAQKGRPGLLAFRGDMERLHRWLSLPVSLHDDWPHRLSEMDAALSRFETLAHGRDCDFWLRSARNMIAERKRELGSSGIADGRERAARLLTWIEQFVDQTETEFLFERQRKLFAIGFNVTEGRRDSSCYDTLASEARLASFIAIATRKVAQEHWFKMSRAMTPVGGNRALISWSASMFEYLMPLLIMKTYPRTLLDDTYEAIIDRHIEYGREKGVPWGISESAYNVQDTLANYQYRAFGVPGLGLKSGLGDELVVAPYATMLAAQLRPRQAVENLEYLAAEGAVGPFGFFESIDYTPERLPEGATKAVVRTYMAHHQAMTLVALDNCLNGNVMQQRFHAEPRVQAAELLLQERSPHLIPLEAPPEEHRVEELPGRFTQPVQRRYVTPHTVTPRTHLLSNGSYSVMVTNSGGGQSRWRDLAVTRWREDSTSDRWGSFIYVRDLDSREFWSAGFHPVAREADHYEVTFAPDRAVFRRREEDIETHTEIVVSPEDDVEIRRISVTNHSLEWRRLELTSYAEVVLAPQAADLAHPAFNNLFIQTTAVPEYRAVICSRRPRTHDGMLFMGHGATLEGPQTGGTEFETDRESFIGRGRSPIRPAVMTSKSPLSGSTGAVLDPIASVRVFVRVPPGRTARVSFFTAVAENEDGIRALIEKYHDPQVASRAFALASTHSEIELRHLGVTKQDENRFQRLAGRVIYDDGRLRSPDAVSENTFTPPDLWKFGISGDLPIVLVTIGDGSELGVGQELIRAQEFLRGRGLKFDLVVLNELATSYRQDVQDDLQRMAESGPSHSWLDRPGGVFLRRADTMTPADRTLLRAVARAIIDGARGNLEAQLRRPLVPPDPPPLLEVASRIPWRPFLQVFTSSERQPATDTIDVAAGLQFFNGTGGFANEGREYHIVGVPPAPWSNVVANAGFGFVATEAALGFTWSQNSYQNRLTPWSNDPIVDPPGEAVFFRDDQTSSGWSGIPSAAERNTTSRSRFGQGYVVYSHTQQNLESEITAFVPTHDPIKIVRVKIRNTAKTKRQISVFYYVEWCLSDNRSRSVGQIVTTRDAISGAVFARNAFRPDFGHRVAFIDTSTAERWVTGDRASFLGRNRTMADPIALQFVHLSGRVGSALDPCGAIQVRMNLDPGQSGEVAFTLGEGIDEESARSLLLKYRSAEAVKAAFEEVRESWDRLLTTVQVRTPDASLDMLINRWLLYQTLSCRVHARSAFYQSGGAYGFRDQLQDVTALLHCDPQLVRTHLLRAASRQFVEGDVQHWWHEPGGEGVRTKIQDDRLWLVYAAMHYAKTTGDWQVFEESVPFIEERAPGPDEESVYERPTLSQATASLYEHCVRAIDRTLAVGSHGLPLMGTGDWNDGMDKVGPRGQGESVWLGWFLGLVLRDFSAFARQRGDTSRAELYEQATSRLARALDGAWDGEWYRRAYFDDGTPLGSKTNAECKIDAIAQAWSVISGLGGEQRQVASMEALEKHLVDSDARLVMLLTPPFDRAEPNPGYIRGYLPGVRENGGQYTHAALWVVLAEVMLGRADRACDLLSFTNPIQRSLTSDAVRRYRTEPYAVAADIYSAAGHVGRGGWTWYTGASGWMYRVVLEHILGIRREGDVLRIDPCIPANWKTYDVILRVGSTRYSITVNNPSGINRGIRSIELDGEALQSHFIPLLADSGTHAVRVLLG